MEDNLLFALLGLVAYVVVSYFLFRWIFAVDKRMKYEKAKIQLLIEMAKKNNVDSETLKNIVKEL